MKKFFFTAGVFFLAAAMFMSVAPRVSAQSTTPQSSPSSDDELKALRDTYKTQLSIYRTDERAYGLAKDQFSKLGTLTSLEVVVKATQKVMLSRTDVLMTYDDIQVATITPTPGIDLAEKAALLQELAALKERLKQHQEVVKLAVDRIQLDKAVKDFNSFSAQIVQVSYKASSYRSYGKMQSVYDKTLAVRGEISAEIEQKETNGLKLGEKRRALDEIDRQFVSTSQNLAKIHKGFQPVRNREASFNSSSYNQTIQDLGSIYTDIYKAITFFREVDQS